MKNFRIILWIAIMTATYSQAQIEPVNKDGLAIGGYDVVAYFSGEAKPGSKNFSTTYKGTIYYFSSKENRKTFKENPVKFLPQFDGFCAWGVAAKKTKFPINPETFDIVDGKLYLFFNGPFNGQKFNTLVPWNKETSKLIKEAHRNWTKVNNR